MNRTHLSIFVWMREQFDIFETETVFYFQHMYKLIKLLIITLLILFICFRDFLYLNVEGTKKKP